MGSAGAIAMLAAPVESRYIDAASIALQTRSQTLAGLMKNADAGLAFGKKSARSSVHLELRYRDRVVIQKIVAGPAFFSAAIAPFPGGVISRSHFSVTRQAANGYIPELGILVVIQHPELAALERQLNDCVPVKLEELNHGSFFNTGSPLLIMEQGWAVGGLLAKVAAMAIRRKWDNKARRKDASAISPDNKFDLSAPADILLRRYEAEIKRKQS
jgi:hypothetical protein